MPALKRLRGSIAACVLLACGIASADEEPTLTDPPNKNPTCEQENAACPQNQPSTSTTTTETTPAPMTSQPEPQPTYTPPPHMRHYIAEERPWYETLGYGIAITGGVDDFVGNDAHSMTSVGGDWGVRLTAGTNSYLAGELSYIGSAQSIDALGLDSSAVLVGNGAQGALRLNLTRMASYVQPFVYGGAAWRHYDITNESFNTSDVANHDDVFEVPVGVGVAGYVLGFMGDVRAEYRGAWGNDLIPNTSSSDTVIGDLDRWAVTASLGAAL
jgi:hypothetical protein